MFVTLLLFFFINIPKTWPPSPPEENKLYTEQFSRKDVTPLTPYPPEDLRYAGFVHTNMIIVLKIEILPCLTYKSKDFTQYLCFMRNKNLWLIYKLLVHANFAKLICLISLFAQGLQNDLRAPTLLNICLDGTNFESIKKI